MKIKPRVKEFDWSRLSQPTLRILLSYEIPSVSLLDRNRQFSLTIVVTHLTYEREKGNNSLKTLSGKAARGSWRLSATDSNFELKALEAPTLLRQLSPLLNPGKPLLSIQLGLAPSLPQSVALRKGSENDDSPTASNGRRERDFARTTVIA